MADRDFLFEYRFDGDIYAMKVVAPDIDTARRKASAMGLAIYKGEIAMTIPASPRGIWRRILALFGENGSTTGEAK